MKVDLFAGQQSKLMAPPMKNAANDPNDELRPAKASQSSKSEK